MEAHKLASLAGTLTMVVFGALHYAEPLVAEPLVMLQQGTQPQPGRSQQPSTRPGTPNQPVERFPRTNQPNQPTTTNPNSPNNPNPATQPVNPNAPGTVTPGAPILGVTADEGMRGSCPRPTVRHDAPSPVRPAKKSSSACN